LRQARIEDLGVAGGELIVSHQQMALISWSGMKVLRTNGDQGREEGGAFLVR
jgi:hypothetical protein